MKLYFTRFSTLMLLVFLVQSCNTPINDSSIKKKDGPRQRIERDVMMMKDPALGHVPNDRLIKAKQYRDELMASQQNIAIPGIDWRQLGPRNQGGRSRAILIDANDPSGNTIWVGSVGGGLWKTTDITVPEPAWAPVDDFFANLAITSIAQDPATSSTMYFCTGEQGYGNADAIRGLGVWKSTNGGTTWSQLASTTGPAFYYCQKIIVNSTGVIFVATATQGLQRSADGGTTWTKVLGTALGITGAVSNLCYDVDIAANGDIYGTLDGSIHKSTNAGVTFNAAQTLPIIGGRIELACAPSDANYVYALVENGGVVNGIIQSTNGGGTWASRTEPNDADPGIPDVDFSRNQAWYDLTIAVDPLQRDVIFVGGIDLFKSFDGGGTWSQISHWYGGFGYTNVHADQHNILFRPGSSSIAYFVNDGGIYRTNNANAVAPVISDKGTNYVTAQFYSCAMHPTALSTYFLAGAQDNGSHQFTQGVVQNTTEVTGGDGAFVHIDQDQPQYQFTSYVYNNYYRSSDGGSTWATLVTDNTGLFINPTDYDDAANILYAARSANQYMRCNNIQTGNTYTTVAVAFGGQVTAIKVSPNTANRVFFGANADVFRVDNAHTGTPTVTNISAGLPGPAYLNCIEVQTGDDNHLLATYTNYGVVSIWESTNGGANWTSVEGNLPDMPVRWALFNPNNSDQAIIATELGVWSTDDLNGGSTVWGSSNSGLANTRVDMLQIRSSDKLMIAATHGRGLFSSDAFTDPTALFTADKLTTYRGVPVSFSSTSYNASSWSWDFGDGATSTSENPSHIYNAAGLFNVTLTINSGASSLIKNAFIHILPNRGTPYSLAAGGNFETNPLDFGVHTAAGTRWERGNSAVAGKNGVVSGSNAWVTGLVGNYADNSDASMMTPNYNFTTPGGYQIQFRSKRNTETNYDGFRVEYTLDSGINWLQVDPIVAPNWYNFSNSAGDAAFPVNEPFFSGAVVPYTLYFRDISFLSGARSVAFRFRFKSDVGVTGPGVAIDDFEIVGAVNLPLAVTLTHFTAVKRNNDVLVNWQTQNEVNISNYILERSYDGSSFMSVTSLGAKNTAANSYSYLDGLAVLNAGTTPYIYYRLKITDNTGRIKFSEVARVTVNKSGPELTIGPHPFTDFVSIYSNEAIKNVMVYDMNGKLVYQTADIRGNMIYFKSKLSKGMYIFKILTPQGIITRKMVRS